MVKNKKILKSSAFSLVMAGLVFLSSVSTSFAGNKKYFLKTTVDYGGFGLLYNVQVDNGAGKSTGTGKNDSPYEERKDGLNYTAVRHYGNIGENNAPTNEDGNIDQYTKPPFLKVNFLEGINSEVTADVLDKRYKLLKEGDENAPLVFTFPGIIHDDIVATSDDYARASLVGETLVTGLNQAIVFINNNTVANLSSKNSLKYLLAKLSYTSEFSDKRIYDYSFGVGTKDIGTFNKIDMHWMNSPTEKEKKELIPVSGLNYGDYVKITIKDGPNGTVYSYFPWRMAKGYKPEQALFENFTGPIQTNIKDKTDAPAFDENEFLTWGQLVLQAMVNSDVQGTSEQDYASDLQTIIGQGLGSDLSRTISSVRNMLGLASMSELILNMGARPSNYHYGVMTKDMHNIALTIYTLNLIISLLFVGFMVVKMLHQKMLSTTNIMAKTSLMEGIKDLAFVAIMLGFFAPLFEILLELNYLIVRTFSYSSEYMSAFNALGSTALSMESMAGFIVSSMFLSIDMYINFVYLVREITVSFLFAIAPIMIVSYLWSPNQKNLVFGYLREIVGNIFMQSFHAITMTFFCAYNSTNMSSLQALTSAYCFIPITQLFRQLVLGNSGGFSEKIGGKLAGQVSTMTMGMRNSALKAKQSKEMFTAQQKANYDIQKAEFDGKLKSSEYDMYGKIANGTIQGGAKAIPIGGGLVGELTGTKDMKEGLAQIAGTTAEAIASHEGVKKGGEIALAGTQEAQKELGKVQSKQADETLSMGLTEMGVGLGISSFDGAGDRMVQSGLSKVEKGAEMKGQAESRMGEGGEYMAKSSALGVQASAYENLYRNAGMGLSSGLRKYGNGALTNREELKEKREKEKEKDNRTIPGIDIDVNDIQQITSKNEITNKFDILFKNANGTISNNPALSEALENFKNRDTNPEKWKESQAQTGIDKFLLNKQGEAIGARLDASHSGYAGYETVKSFNEATQKMEDTISKLKFEK